MRDGDYESLGKGETFKHSNCCICGPTYFIGLRLVVVNITEKSGQNQMMSTNDLIIVNSCAQISGDCYAVVISAEQELRF